MSDPRALRFLAAHYASATMHRPLNRHRHRDATQTLEALVELELVDSGDAVEWQERLNRLRVDAVERPLLPRPLRDAARAYLAKTPSDRRRFARHVLQTVGALSWQDDPDARSPEALVVDRVIPVTAQVADDVTIASVTLYRDAIELRWYAAAAATRYRTERAPGTMRSPYDLELRDDRGTHYDYAGAGSSNAPGQVTPGHTRFHPGPPGDALWVEIVRREVTLARVALLGGEAC